MANLRADNLTGTGGRNAIKGSVYFGGGVDQLQSATSSDFAFGTGAYTLEFWVKSGRASGENGLFGTFTSGAHGIGIWHDAANLYFEERVNGYAGAPRVHYNNFDWSNWNHLAMSRDSTSGTMRAFVNGVQVGTVTSSLKDLTATSETTIGHNGAAANNAIAYISNLRLNNTQLYTAAFTPPTEKLTAVDGTVLLCCQDSDNPLQEATGKTITGYGSHDRTGVDLTAGGTVNAPGVLNSTNYPSAAGEWSFSNGTATINSSASDYDFLGNATGYFQNGELYELVANITAYTSGKFELGQNGAGNVGVNLSAVGRMSFRWKYSGNSVSSGVAIYSKDHNGVANFSCNYLSIKKVESGKASKVLPPVGVDEGVLFDGDIKMNSQGVMYFPTGDTSQRGRGRGVIVAGENPAKNKSISYVEMQSGGIAVDFGNLTKNCGENKAVGSSTRGVIQLSGDDPATINTLEYITFATTSNSTDFGDLFAAWWMRATGGNNTRGLFAGGLYPGSTFKLDVEYITIATTGNGIDFGDLQTARNAPTGCASPTRFLVAGGQSGPATSDRLNTIDYFTIATTGNYTDFGDLTAGGKEGCSVASSTRGVFGPRLAAPGIVNTIDYVTIASTGNATDFGDGLTARGGSASLSNSIRGAWAGGYTPSKVNSIEFVNIATTSNAFDFGDITYVNQYGGGCSDSHGGLS